MAEFNSDAVQVYGLEHVDLEIANIVLLPTSVRDDTYVFGAQTTTVLKLFRAHGVPVQQLDTTKPSVYYDARGLNWLCPTIFISLAAYAQNPHLVTVSLNLVSSYLYDFFTGKEGLAHIQMRVLLEMMGPAPKTPPTEPPPHAKFKLMKSRRGDTHMLLVEYDGPLDGYKKFKSTVELLVGNGEEK